MAQPGIPTNITLATEGLRQARIFNPTPAQISLYSNEVMEQLKNDLWQEVKQMKPLMTFSYGVLVPGQSRYSCPDDFSSDLSMVILVGLTTGSVLSATTNSITIPASIGNLSPDQTMGKEVLITSGTASASASQIITLVQNPNQTTTLTVYPEFQQTPDATSTFMIVDNQYPCEADHIANYDKFRPSYLNRPRKFYAMGDQSFDEFIFDCAPDAQYVYGIRMRYYVNIMTIDLNSDLMSSLYQKFRDYWIKGVKAQALADNDDTTADAARAEAQNKLQQLIMSQQYGTDIHTLSQHCEDYGGDGGDYCGGGPSWRP